jgi:hypothetical protein
MKTRGILPIAASAALMLLSVVSPAFAHHGEAGAYALDETIKLQGVVREVRWSNPHVIVMFDVQGTSGVEQWSIELSSINTMEQGGAKRDALAMGDQIVVTGHRRKDTKLLILPRMIQRPDGTTALPVPVRRGIFGEAAK